MAQRGRFTSLSCLVGPLADLLYWQKIEQKSVKVVYLCRSISEGKIQKTARCQSAGPVKPG